jgi:hypothetical protein
MTLVSNKGKTPLGLPSGEQVPARGSVEVKDWSKAQENETVKAWVEAGVLTEGELPELTAEEQAAELASVNEDPNRVSQEDFDAAHAAGQSVPYDYQPPGERHDPEEAPPPEADPASRSRRRPPSE